MIASYNLIVQSFFGCEKWIDFVSLEFSLNQHLLVFVICNQSLFVEDSLRHRKWAEYQKMYKYSTRLGCVPPYLTSICEGWMLSNILFSVLNLLILIFSTVTSSRKVETIFQEVETPLGALSIHNLCSLPP